MGVEIAALELGALLAPLALEHAGKPVDHRVQKTADDEPEHGRHKGKYPRGGQGGEPLKQRGERIGHQRFPKPRVSTKMGV
jgi:hypothetical protein